MTLLKIISIIPNSHSCKQRKGRKKDRSTARLKKGKIQGTKKTSLAKIRELKKKLREADNKLTRLHWNAEAWKSACSACVEARQETHSLMLDKRRPQERNNSLEARLKSVEDHLLSEIHRLRVNTGIAQTSGLILTETLWDQLQTEPCPLVGGARLITSAGKEND